MLKDFWKLFWGKRHEFQILSLCLFDNFDFDFTVSVSQSKIEKRLQLHLWNITLFPLLKWISSVVSLHCFHLSWDLNKNYINYHLLFTSELLKLNYEVKSQSWCWKWNCVFVSIFKNVKNTSILDAATRVRAQLHR